MRTITPDVEIGAESDERLMARYADGCGEAFEELFARYERRAYGFFLSRTRSRERAQDLYQELFLRVHRARDRFDPTRPFAPWFFQIARRLLVDDHCLVYRSREVSIDDRPVASTQSDSEELLATSEQITDALAILSSEERLVVLAAKGEGVGYDELAIRLGRSAVAVRKMASRAVKRMRLAGPLIEAPNVRAH